MGDDLESKVLRYNINLKIVHPSDNPASYSVALAWEPVRQWQVGDARVGPTGRPLDGGTREETFWSGSEYVEGSPCFMRNVAEIVGHLEDRESLMRRVVRDGGKVSLSIGLHGELDIADTMEAGELVRLARLGIDLDLECFPKFNRRPR